MTPQIRYEDITWTLDSPLNKADPKYISQYFACLNVISRQRMNQRAKTSQVLNDACGALIAFVQDENEQKRLWELRDRLIYEKCMSRLNSGEIWDNTALMEVMNEVSDEILGEIHVWFSHFWSISLMQTLHFKRTVYMRKKRKEDGSEVEEEIPENELEMTLSEEDITAIENEADMVLKMTGLLPDPVNEVENGT